MFMDWNVHCFKIILFTMDTLLSHETCFLFLLKHKLKWIATLGEMLLYHNAPIFYTKHASCQFQNMNWIKIVTLNIGGYNWWEQYLHGTSHRCNHLLMFSQVCYCIQIFSKYKGEPHDLKVKYYYDVDYTFTLLTCWWLDWSTRYHQQTPLTSPLLVPSKDEDLGTVD